MIYQIKIKIAYFTYFILLLYYRHSPNKQLVDQDISRWAKELNIWSQNTETILIQLLRFHKQFRNIFYLRCNNIPNIIRTICKPDNSLILAEHNENNIVSGGAIYTIHAFGSIIRAKYIGHGCTFRQLTTIGTKATEKPMDAPTILNNVDFGANVVCIGDITIGNNSIIGAGSVVVKDVPDYAVVAGNPAKIIKYKAH